MEKERYNDLMKERHDLKKTYERCKEDKKTQAVLYKEKISQYKGDVNVI